MKRVFHIKPQAPNKAELITRCGAAIREWLSTGQEIIITLAEPRRTSEINAAMWCVLNDIADQVGWVRPRWRGNVCVQEGHYANLLDAPDAKRVTAEEFKDVFTAAYRKPRLLGGVDGGVVAIGMRTSTMTQAQVRDVILIAEAFGASHGVEWSDTPASEAA